VARVVENLWIAYFAGKIRGFWGESVENFVPRGTLLRGLKSLEREAGIRREWIHED
jgi:hypothetical protein